MWAAGGEGEQREGGAQKEQGAALWGAGSPEGPSAPPRHQPPAIPNQLYFNLKQQFTVQFIHGNTIHCDHNAINLCFK